MTLSHGYWLFDTPCTQALWEAVMGNNPSRFKSPTRPVESVSFDDVQRFVSRINAEMPGLDLALPAEAQWEYACRAGTSTATYAGGMESLGENNAPVLDSIAWYGGNSGVEFELDDGYDSSDWREKQHAHERAGTRPAGMKAPNGWGLYDMLGNVWEWCADHWHDSYDGAPANGSAWIDSGIGSLGHVIRGGSWGGNAHYVRAAIRSHLVPPLRDVSLGFRCARVQVMSTAEETATAAPAYGRRAERRPSEGAPHAAGQLGEEGWDLPRARRIVVRSNRDELYLERVTKPNWASAMGRDRFGLYADVSVPSKAEDVIQRLRWIPPGRFWMGSPPDEEGRYDFEGPRHEMTIRDGYWLFGAPCTQALWEAVMGNNPSRFKSPPRPVESVSFDDVQEFLKHFGERMRERDPDLGARARWDLPSEAQWEYACRAGTTTATYAGEMRILGENNAPVLDSIAWYGGNSGAGFELDDGYDSSGWSEKQYAHERAGTRPVGMKAPNPWGLYDTLGNVWEWCADHWHDSYDGAPADGSAWINSGKAAAGRVIRGGSWFVSARDARAASRVHDDPSFRDSLLGFRCARVQVVSTAGGSAVPRRQ
jgi:formylglycine-generating enzyme required for sulfatase activity